VPSPSVGSGDNFLFGVAAVSARSLWAVGSDSVSFGRTLAIRWNGSAWSVGARRVAPGRSFRTLAEHWNGTSWTVAPTPSRGTADDWLYGAATVPGRGFWAVGTAGGNTLTEFGC
jgi:hypothetical protein